MQWTICVKLLELYKTINHLNCSCHMLAMFKIWTHLKGSCWQTWPNNPRIRWMLSFISQGELGKLGKLSTFTCYKKEFRKTPIVSLNNCINSYGSQLTDFSEGKIGYLNGIYCFPYCCLSIKKIREHFHFQIAFTRKISPHKIQSKEWCHGCHADSC